MCSSRLDVAHLHKQDISFRAMSGAKSTANLAVNESGNDLMGGMRHIRDYSEQEEVLLDSRQTIHTARLGERKNLFNYCKQEEVGKYTTASGVYIAVQLCSLVSRKREPDHEHLALKQQISMSISLSGKQREVKQEACSC